MNYKNLYIIIFLVFFSCSNDNYKKLKGKKIKVDIISRKKNDTFYQFQTPKQNKPPKYSFEEDAISIIRITKEFFRCKGNSLNPERIDESDKNNIKVYLDCEGSLKHTLPLINGKEGVYSILIDILNYIQKRVKKKVIITCAHRCPKHNAYADILNNAKTSKHMIGAEVDFYVQGYEHNPKSIIDIIFDFYKESSKHKTNNEFELFEKSDTQNAWYNKEILIKLYQYNEGRDFDNRHSYPYISIQVLFDRITKEKVSYNWEKAHNIYLH